MSLNFLQQLLFLMKKASFRGQLNSEHFYQKNFILTKKHFFQIQKGKATSSIGKIIVTPILVQF